MFQPSNTKSACVGNVAGMAQSEGLGYRDDSSCKIQRATLKQGQEEVSQSIEALQSVIVDGLLRRLAPVLNVDPDNILQATDTYFAGAGVCDSQMRGASEVNRMSAQQHHRLTVLLVILNHLLEQLDLP